MDYNKASDEIIARLSHVDEDKMPAAVDRQSSLKFAWHALPGLLKQFWWLYLAVAAIAAAIETLPYGERIGRAVDIVAIGLPTAFAACRLLKPNLKWSQSLAVGLAVTYALPLLLVDQIYQIPHAESQPLKVLLGVAILVLVWPQIKLGAAGPLFLLSDELSVLGALRGSWSLVRGDVWWKFFGLELVTLVPFAVLGSTATWILHNFIASQWLSVFIDYALGAAGTAFFLPAIAALTQRRGA